MIVGGNTCAIGGRNDADVIAGDKLRITISDDDAAFYLQVLTRANTDISTADQRLQRISALFLEALRDRF